MQIESAQLKRQQEILKALGFYKGSCDGIWGPKSISAMKSFECSGNFKPGIPMNGMPLKSVKPWPAGYTLSRDGMLDHPVLAQQKEKESPKEEVLEEVVTPKKADKQK